MSHIPGSRVLLGRAPPSRHRQGPFVRNALHGMGVWTGANGDVYEGDFARHARHGQGSLRAADGTR
jgi:hypothetical protein